MSSSNSPFSTHVVPDSVVMFFAVTVTSLFLMYREKAHYLKTTSPAHKKKVPYVKPPKEFRSTSAAPSIKVVAKGNTEELTGHTLEGYL